MVDLALRSYFLTPASETNPDEVQEAIRGLKVGKAPGLNGITSRALKHLLESGIPPRPDFQRGPPLSSLSFNMEARSSDFQP
jgi:hypothetical protein